MYKYRVEHILHGDSGINAIDGHFNNLEMARNIAAQVMANGQETLIRRLEDGKTFQSDGSWS